MVNCMQGQFMYVDNGARDYSVNVLGVYRKWQSADFDAKAYLFS